MAQQHKEDIEWMAVRSLERHTWRNAWHIMCIHTWRKNMGQEPHTRCHMCRTYTQPGMNSQGGHEPTTHKAWHTIMPRQNIHRHAIPAAAKTLSCPPLPLLPVACRPSSFLFDRYVYKNAMLLQEVKGAKALAQRCIQACSTCKKACWRLLLQDECGI